MIGQRQLRVRWNPGRRSWSRYSSAQVLSDALVAGERGALAEAITLVESRRKEKRDRGDELLAILLTRARERRNELGPDSLSFRIGMTGSPGVGKSSMIEALGDYLIEQDKKVAVLTVDPSSHTSGGSILGDMNRMPRLSVSPRAFVRSSPTHGSLGGVTRGTQEAIVLVEAAGYDVVLVETVGVGQSEVEVASMVDLFCLLISPTHGDELQGVKRGVMEACELVVVTKADGDLLPAAKLTQAEHISALKYFRQRTPNWRTPVLRASAHTGEGLAEMWKVGMAAFWDVMLRSGELEARRDAQLQAWMRKHLEAELLLRVRKHPEVAATWRRLEKEVREGRMTPGRAAELTLNIFLLDPGRETPTRD